MKRTSALFGGMMTLALASMVLTSSAFAESTTTATASSVAPKLKDKLVLTYFGVFSGPSVRGISELDGSLPDSTTGAPDATGEKVNLWSRVTAGYKLNSTLTAAAASEFTMKANPDFVMSDPYAVLMNSNIFSIGHFKLNGDMLRVYAPISQKSRKDNKLTGLRSFLMFNYEFAGTPWSAVAYTFFHKNIYAAGTTSGTDTLARVSPFISYQVSPRLNINGGGDILAGQRSMGSSFFDWTTAQDMVFDLGAGYDVTPHFTVNPYLEIPTNSANARTLETLTVNVLVAAKLL